MIRHQLMPTFPSMPRSSEIISENHFPFVEPSPTNTLEYPDAAKTTLPFKKDIENVNVNNEQAQRLKEKRASRQRLNRSFSRVGLCQPRRSALKLTSRTCRRYVNATFVSAVFPRPFTYRKRLHPPRRPSFLARCTLRAT